MTPAERKTIVEQALALDDGWLDGDVPLTDSEKALLEERFRDLAAYPETSIPWDEAKAELAGRKKDKFPA